jgi:PDZ domain-containing protein
MSRQLRTLIVGAVLCLVLGFLSFGMHVPYVVLSPGPTVNTLGRDDQTKTDVIVIKGHEVSKTSGNLNLTTVSVETSDTTVAGAIRGWLARDEVVVPHDSIYPPGKTQQQVNEQDKQDFTESQNSATAAAACELNYPKGFGVASVSGDSPNADVLRTGDQFVSLNGKPVTDDASLRTVLQTLKEGAKVPAVVTRAQKQVPVTLTLGTPNPGSTSPRIGITLTEGCLLPFEVAVDLTGIGGPSAGLMFALGIIDKVGTDDLTHGRFIAGTGTIDSTGNVGEIGGIQLKMLGARRAGATIFLAPAGNCPDVRGNVPSGLRVVKVSSLHEAIADLAALANGGSAPSC